MIYKFCNKLGCDKLIDVTAAYCSEHKSEAGARYKDYDKNKRNKEFAKFYASEAWVKARYHTLTYYSNLDIYDYYINHIIRAADTVHHIVELSEDWNKRLKLDNLISLSPSTHSMIHSLYSRKRVETQKLLKDLQKKYENEFKIAK